MVETPDIVWPILIVEDSEDDYETTVRALKRGGASANPIFHCDCADDAIDFLLQRNGSANAKESPRPGFVLLDLNMPGKDGKAILRAVKGDPKTRNIPVIVLTTSTDENDFRECYALGANTCITKPVNLDRFFEVIQMVSQYWLDVANLSDGGS
jgi:two-component system response regulator